MSVATHFDSCNNYKIKLTIAFLFYVYARLGFYNLKNMAFFSLIHKYNLTQMPVSTWNWEKEYNKTLNYSKCVFIIGKWLLHRNSQMGGEDPYLASALSESLSEGKFFKTHF